MFSQYRLIIAAIFFLANTGLWAATPLQYAIIVDAGSSGTRLHLFKYENKEPLPVIQDILTESNEIPISSYNSRPTLVLESIADLVNKAVTKLQSDHVDLSSVSFDFYGTAGMRLLARDEAENVYKNINTYLRAHFPFQFQHINTLNDTMEGVYGWLDVNYLGHRFDNNADQPMGIIDLGGASVEIAFATTQHAAPENVVTITINNKKYKIFSKNFLSLGQDEARSTINNDEIANTCYPLNFKIKLHNQDEMGNYQFATCRSLYGELLKKYQVLEQIPSHNDIPFVAYSGAHYTLSFFDVGNRATQPVVDSHIQTECAKPWEQLKHDHAQTPEKYASIYCANGAYLSELLFNVLQLKEGELSVSNQINQQKIDWTLGALLYSLL